MSKFPALLVFLLAASAQADMIVHCDAIVGGKVDHACETTVSTPKGDGEVKLDRKQSISMSSVESCALGDYDLKIENVTQDAHVFPGADDRLREAIESSIPTTYKVTLVNYKKGNRKKPKSKGSDTIADLSFGQTGMTLGYSSGGVGLNCSVKNHR